MEIRSREIFFDNTVEVRYSKNQSGRVMQSSEKKKTIITTSISIPVLQISFTYLNPSFGRDKKDPNIMNPNRTRRKFQWNQDFVCPIVFDLKLYLCW